MNPRITNGRLLYCMSCNAKNCEPHPCHPYNCQKCGREFHALLIAHGQRVAQQQRDTAAMIREPGTTAD